MIKQPWPTYSDAGGEVVLSLPIKIIDQAVDG